MGRSAKSPGEGKGASLVLIVLNVIGLVTVAAGIAGVVNTALGAEWRLEVYGTTTALPRTWGSAIALLAAGIVWTLIALGLNTRGVRGHMARQRLISLALIAGVLGGGFFLIRSCDEDLRRRAAEERFGIPQPESTVPDSLLPRKAPWADRKAGLIFTNPTLDTLYLFIDGEARGRALPGEAGQVRIPPGRYRLCAAAEGDTVEARVLEVPEGTRRDRSLHYVFNVKGEMSLALLDISDMYHDKRRRAPETEAGFRLLNTWFREPFFSFNVDGASVVLPRRPSLLMSYNTPLKLVIVPEEWEGDNGKVLNYAIWKYRLDDSRGVLQDGIDFYMLSKDQQRAKIRNRLRDNVKRFEAERGN